MRRGIDFVRTRRKTFCLLACVVLFLAGLSRYWVSYDPSDSVPYGGESMRLAHSLYDTGNFANPFFSLHTGSSAHLSPVFPAFLAILMKVFGNKSTGIYAIELAAVLILSLQLALYPVFSTILGMGEINGIVGAAIWIAAKPRLVYNWEVLYVAILIAVACCCYRRYLDEETQRRSRLAWSLGCLMGLLILTSPTVAPIYATWLAWEVWRHRMAFFRESFLALVLLPIVILAPWVIRNYFLFHSFPVIRDNLGLELSVSNNDCAQFGTRANIASGCFEKFHPNMNVNEARKVKELGEVKYNQLQLREALHWISKHPSRFSKLSIMRCIAFWMPTETFSIHYASGRRSERFAIYMMTLLSAPGLIILYRCNIKSALLLISCLMVFPLVYYIVQFEDQYRYAIMWVTFLLGAVPITASVRRLWDAFSACVWCRRQEAVPSLMRPGYLRHPQVKPVLQEIVASSQYRATPTPAATRGEARGAAD